MQKEHDYLARCRFIAHVASNYALIIFVNSISIVTTMIMVSSTCVLEAEACLETIDLSKGDQKEDEHDHLQETVAPANLEMGCCGCADEPSSKVEPTVNIFSVLLLKKDPHIYECSVLVKNNNNVAHLTEKHKTFNVSQIRNSDFFKLILIRN